MKPFPIESDRNEGGNLRNSSAAIVKNGAKVSLKSHSILFYSDLSRNVLTTLTLLGLGLIKINTVSANFNNPRSSLIINN